MGFTTFPLFSDDLGPPSKRCSRCKEVKPLTEFAKVSHKRLGVDCLCKKCKHECDKERHARRRIQPGTMKQCSQCHDPKPVSEFYELASGRYGVTSVCKECFRKHRNNLYSQNDEYKRAILFAMRKKRYGIDRDEYDRMFAAQDGLCAICGNPPSGKKNEKDLAVDHCHTSGCLRMLLCGDCNRGLGCFKDDPAFLRKAADYIERFRDDDPSEQSAG